MEAVFYNDYVKRIQGINVKSFGNKLEAVDAIREDIRRFRAENECDRLVMAWCASTEIFIMESEIHQDIESFVGGLRENNARIARCSTPTPPFWRASHGSPNLSVDGPLEKLARDEGVPVCGKDFKTGQTPSRR